MADVPGHSGPCVKVVFPLPNGNAIVRADHHLKIWGLHFLRLHYRMRRRP